MTRRSLPSFPGTSRRRPSILAAVLLAALLGTLASPGLAHAQRALGATWHQKEGDWQGVWTLRPGGGALDMVWSHQGARVTAVGTVRITADLIAIDRRHGSDGNDCNYIGRIAADGASIAGSFLCTNGTNSSWQATLAAPDLGRVWTEQEGPWAGTWVRRGRSNVFDATWTDGKTTVTAVLVMELRDQAVRFERPASSDGNVCSYEGTLSADRASISGMYSCKTGGPWGWKATIAR